MNISILRLSLPGTRERALTGLLLAAFFLTACSSGVKVRADISPTTDFSKYNTYNFFDPMGIEGGYNSPIFGEVFRSAISQEMSARGYRKSDNPDLVINVTSRIDDKVSMKTYTTPYMSGGYYSRPGGAYYGSSVGVGVGVSSRATKTEEASIFIDLVDNAGERISWQGVSVITVSDKKVQKLKETVDYSVGKVFELYPHRAGQ
jgi:hypothetical protein